MKYAKISVFEGFFAARLVLLAAGVVAVGIAGTILFAPEAFYASYGIELADNLSLANELKAPAGALLVAGLFMFAGVLLPKHIVVSLVVATVIYLSYGLSRVLSMATDGFPNTALLQATGFELIVGVIALLSLLQVRAIKKTPSTHEEITMPDSTKNMTTDKGSTLVLGGTGKTGRRVVERLQARGVETRVGSRSASPAFDWNDRGTWEAAISEVRAAYITYVPDLAIPGATDAIRAFAQMAVDAGVERLVLLSGRGEEEAQACERIVRDAGVDWTIVRSSWFNQNFSEGEFLGMVLDGAITLPAADIPEPFIDTNDIADVVVAALTEEGHAGEIYEVTGPRMLTFAEAAKEISVAAGRNVQFMRVPGNEFAAGLTDSGAPEDITWLLNYLFDTVLDGRNAYVCDGVQRAIGREPTDFSEYASRVAATGIWNTDSNVATEEAA